MSTKRKSEMWISNNRVLVGGNKKVTGRNPNFDTEETKLLISLWGDPKVQKTLITTHKKHAVIVKLAEQMREYGYYRSPEEINTRIKNLKCFYNRIKKDMEMGIAIEPTWKHYQSMDEIMTRPIFSVRPNEIPKPSLRYRLEEELRDKEMNEKSEKDVEVTSDEDEKMSITQEMFEEEMAHETEIEEEETKVKEENENSSDVEETPLIIPKQEPIDLDDMMDSPEKDRNDEENGDIFPKLSAYLQLANSTSSNVSTLDTSKIITTIAGSAITSSSDSSNTLKISQPIVIANQQSNQAGKISLVPTNFLLKPPQQPIQIRPQPQHRFLYTKSGNQATSGIVTSGAGQMPMKVLLVNALQKSPNTTTTTVGANGESQIKTITTTSLQNQLRPNAVNGDKSQKLQSPPKKKEDLSSFKALLGQLVQVQTENLDVQRQRLELERQRLDFEKSSVERIINAISASQIPNGGSPLLQPKIEKDD